jgi:hypothetical protein
MVSGGLTGAVVFDEHVFGHGDLGGLTGRAERRVQDATHPDDQTDDSFGVEAHVVVCLATSAHDAQKTRVAGGICLGSVKIE